MAYCRLKALKSMSKAAREHYGKREGSQNIYVDPIEGERPMRSQDVEEAIRATNEIMGADLGLGGAFRMR
jgi:hypothetical protein